MIIDFEHHYTPYEIWKRRGGKSGQVVRLFSSEGKAINTLGDADHDVQTHLDTMDRAGIDMAVLSGSIDSLEEARLFNDQYSRVAEKYPKRFAGFASTLPLGGKPALDELERAIRGLGLKGVTISSQIDGASLDSRDLWPFYERVSKLGVPIFVHISRAPEGFDAGKAPYDLNRSIVREFALALATSRICLGGVLEDFPDLKFIVSHFGGGISSVKERLERYIRYWDGSFWSGKPLIKAPFVERFNEHFAKIYFNMAGREIGMETVKCALTNISPKRLVFGTDYPLNFADDSAGIKTYIQKIKELDLGNELIEGMLGTNGIRLLSL